MHLNKTELNAANSNSGSWVDRIIAYESALAEGATPAPSSSGDLPKEDQERLDYGCKAVNALQQAFQNQPEPEAESAPQTLGDFRIIREIGRGGMGTVYEAQQLSMGRSVALKVLPFAAIVDGKALKRFRNEVRAAAALDHPHIVSVYSIGEERGIHYFSMQLIRGQSLADLILQTRSEVAALQGKEVVRASARNGLGNEELTIDSDVAASRSTIREEQSQVNTAPRSRRDSKRYRAAAQLGIETADALQHAHDQGVLHRDIKPSNLLLDAEGSLYVADFGLARIEAEAGLTLTGDIIGTLRYMAPEQALANRVVIDHRADIYSLGATLYELLTLQPAFDSADRSDLLRQIAFEEPMPLRRRDPRIALELETIVLKAMARSPEERYSTAQELTDDLQAYLDNRPIKARRPNLLEKAVKWSRRHQAAVIAAAGCLALLACVASAAAIAIEGKRQEAEKHRQHAIQERDESYYRQYVAQMRQGQQDWENGKTSRLLQTLAEHLPTEARADFRGWEWYYLLSLCDTAKHTIEVGDGYASHVSVSPDGKYVLTSGAEVKLWELPSWKLIREFRGHIGPVYDVCWSPDGSRIASAGKDSTVRIWEPFTGRQLQKLPGRRDVPCVKWSPHGSWIATSTDATHVQLQNVDSGEAGPTLDYGGYVYDIAWSPGGKKVAVVGGGQGGTRVWRADTGELISTLPSQPHDKFDVAWSPDGRWLANTTYGYARVQVWDTQSGELAQLLHGHQGGVNCIAWSDDGSQLASGGRDESVVVWNAKTGEQTNTLRDHTGWVRSLDWLPNGKSLISADASGEIRVWDLSKAGNPRQISIAEGDDNIDRGRIWSWSKDSTGFLSLDRKSGEIEKLDALSGRKVSVLEGNVGRVSACVWNASGDGLATASSKDNVIDIWRVDPKHSVVHRAALRVRNGEQPLALCPDSRYVTTSCAGDDSAVWDVDSERELFRIPTTNPRSAAWSPAGNVLALAEESTLLSLWEVPSGRHLSSLSAGRWKLSIAWSADGRQLAAGGFRQRVDTWDVASGNVILKMDGHHGRVSGVAWSPDGSRIASNGYGQVKFWDAATGEEVLSVESDVTGQLYWSPDGRSLAGTRFGGSTLVVFDASRGYQVANRLKPNAATKIPTALRPEFPGNWVTRANFLLENHRPQEYLDLCRYLVASADVFRSPDAVRALSRTCALAPNALDDYRVPISAARRVSAENPEDATLIIYLAALLYRSGDWEGAHRLLLAEQSNLNDAAAGDQALAWCWLAMTEYRLNDGSAAEDHLEKVSEMEIDDLSPEVGVVVSRLRNEASALIRGDD